MKTNKWIILAIVISTLAACNKTTKNTNRLKGETWQVTALTIDGNAEEADHLPLWEFEDCDNYDEICMGHWVLGDEDEAHFAWQFDEKGSKFSISNQSEAGHDHDHEDDDHEGAHSPVDQCTELSGTYSVDESKRKTMKFSSDQTIGHPGELVEISIEKVE